MNRIFRSFDLAIYIWGLFYFNLFIFYLSIFSFYPINVVGLMFTSLKNFIIDFLVIINSYNYSKSFIFIFFCLFITLFLQNFISVFPYDFPRTSHFFVISLLSFGLWFSINLFYLLNYTRSFVVHLVPLGTPLFLVFLIFVIELVRNFIRPLTLTVRLLANVVSGHLLLVLLSSVLSFYRVLGVSAFFTYLFLNLVELLVSFIQSYIFCTLICLYYSDLF